MILSKKTFDRSYIALLIVYISCYFIIGKINRTETNTLFLVFFVLIFCYLLWSISSPNSLSSWILGLSARIVLFFSFPSLSDDFYRFLWDGHLLHEGINPYLVVPNIELLPDKQLLYSGLNSARYFTVYPPLNQFIFWCATFFTDVLTSVNLIRTTLLLADVLSYFFLIQLTKSEKLANWYWLNPLVIIEFTGNLHMEGWVICGLIGAIFFMQKSKTFLAGLFLGLSISMKIIPLLFFPVFIMAYYRKPKELLTFLSGVSILSLSLFPQIYALVSAPEILSSFKLYFTSFEFNASLYFIAREWGLWRFGYNIIQSLGPKMAFTSLFFIISLYGFYFFRKINTIDCLLFTLFIYLIFSTTVHPWYVLPLLPLGLLGGWYFPIVWSLLVSLSYLGYSITGYDLPAIWLFLEYGFVFALVIYEIWTKYVVGKKLTVFNSLSNS